MARIFPSSHRQSILTFGRSISYAVSDQSLFYSRYPRAQTSRTEIGIRCPCRPSRNERVLFFHAGVFLDSLSSFRTASTNQIFQFSEKFEPYPFGDKHGNRLSQHGGLGLNAAHAPAQNAQAVDHGGMRIRAHQRVRISAKLAVHFVFKRSEEHT